LITSPFDATSTATEVIAGRNLSGKTALVTGATSGLGLETARAFLSANAEVILAVRDSAKGEAVSQSLQVKTGNPRVHVLPLDLSSLSKVRRAAKEFQTRWSKLDLLIDNAGIMGIPLTYSSDGFEQQFATNHLGHHLLTVMLLPALKSAAPSRVIVLSSSAHRRSDVHFEDLHYHRRPYDKWEAYGQSKTANALFAVGLTRQFRNEGITANAVNPGGTRTGLQQHLSPQDLLDIGWSDPKGKDARNFKNIEQGAATTVWAAVAENLERVGGLYLENCQEAAPHDPAEGSISGRFHGYMPYALDPSRAERLWAISEDLVGLRN